MLAGHLLEKALEGWDHDLHWDILMAGPRKRDERLWFGPELVEAAAHPVWHRFVSISVQD